MRNVVIAGAGMTAFGKFLDRNLKSLVAEATSAALSDAAATPADVGAVYFGNVAAGLMCGQESLRGQHALRGTGLQGIPLVNVENACASGATAVHLAWLSVASGQTEVALAIGAEKLYHADRAKPFAAMSSVLDQERLDELFADLGGEATDRSVFMDLYARFARQYMDRTGATQEDFARVAAKNHAHGSLNPKAQHRTRFTVEEILAARPIAGPLTLPMCAPIGDGAAAVVITTPERAAQLGAHPVRLLASVLGGGQEGRAGLVPATARRAFETAGVDPEDVDVVACHDATAPAELIVTEELGLCPPGDAPKLLRAGDTTLGGRIPINPCGGLESKGHPIGATGVAQIVELTDQLRDRCGARQVQDPRIALAENAGGYLGPDAAAATVTILAR
ncbi:MAG TPA: thiolase family protein [Acidimicrobiales bacterium]|jgi:acetyl-CoA acetyltransferase